MGSWKLTNSLYRAVPGARPGPPGSERPPPRRPRPPGSARRTGDSAPGRWRRPPPGARRGARAAPPRPPPARPRTGGTPACRRGRRPSRQTGGGVVVQVVGIMQGLEEARGAGDHRRVVRAELHRRYPQREGELRAELLDPPPELRVRRHTAADGHPPGSLALDRVGEPAHERIDDRPLVRGGEVGPPAPRLRFTQVPDRVEQGGLQPAEAEVQGAGGRPRQVERLWVAISGEPVELRAARVAEPEQASPLVERLAGSVVEGLTQHLVRSELLDPSEEGVTAARHQAQVRRLDGGGAERARG